MNKKYLIPFLGLLFTGCTSDKKKEIEIKSEEVGIEADTSEMLILDKDEPQSASNKSFLSNFNNVDRVSFAFDSSSLSPADVAYLKKVVGYLIVNVDLHIEIQGNCDIRGTKDYNMALGERRAYSVLKFLKEHGVPEHRMSAVSSGSRVIVPGDTDEIYAQNRVGIIIIK